jgi:hypothetical protein
MFGMSTAMFKFWMPRAPQTLRPFLQYWGPQAPSRWSQKTGRPCWSLSTNRVQALQICAVPSCPPKNSLTSNPAPTSDMTLCYPSDMMCGDKLHILSVNMNRSNHKLISLLETTPADCVLIQEPWWGSLVPRHSDHDPDDDPSFGTVNHPAWTPFIPSLSTSLDGHPRVITFIWKRVLSSCSVTPITSLSFYDLLGVSICTPSFQILILNFYHHIQRHQGNLTHLIDRTLDSLFPILLGGDFNTHSDTWSPGGKWVSPWAPALEAWLNDQGFISTVPDGSISRRSTSSCPSLIDFIFINEAFLEVPSFPVTCLISFELSTGSDHAGLLLSLPFSPTPPHLHHPPGWKINPDQKAEWCSFFGSLPLPTITDETSLLQAARGLLLHISLVSDSFFPRKPPPTDRDLPWWSQECSYYNP